MAPPSSLLLWCAMRDPKSSPDLVAGSVCVCVEGFSDSRQGGGRESKELAPKGDRRPNRRKRTPRSRGMQRTAPPPTPQTSLQRHRIGYLTYLASPAHRIKDKRGREERERDATLGEENKVNTSANPIAFPGEDSSCTRAMAHPPSLSEASSGRDTGSQCSLLCSEMLRGINNQDYCSTGGLLHNRPPGDREREAWPTPQPPSASPKKVRQKEINAPTPIATA